MDASAPILFSKVIFHIISIRLLLYKYFLSGLCFSVNYEYYSRCRNFQKYTGMKIIWKFLLGSNSSYVNQCEHRHKKIDNKLGIL